MNKIDEISEKVVIEAALIINGYDLKNKEILCDHIHKVQPNIFLTTVDLINHGVSHAKLDHVLNVLMVTHLAFDKEPYISTRQIGSDDIEYVSQKHLAMLSFLQSEPDNHTWKLTITSYPQKPLWAYIMAYLQERGIEIQMQGDAYIFTMAKIIVDAYHCASVNNVLPN